MTYMESEQEVMLILREKPLHDNFFGKSQAVACHSILKVSARELNKEKNYTWRTHLNSIKIHMWMTTSYNETLKMEDAVSNTLLPQ